MFQYHGAKEDIPNLLTRLSTYKNHLPQGAPTSPSIARLVLEPFARELENILKKIPKSSLSIYVNDIILSAPKGVKRFLPTIKKMLTRYGLKINNKTKIMYKDEEQICLDIRVNDGIGPPTAYVQEMQELSKLVPPSDPRLKGKISYIDYLKRPIIN